MNGQRNQNKKRQEELENETIPNEKKADREKIKELESKRKEMQEELDELRGRTVKGKAACVLAFFLSLGVLLGIFVGMVKLDIGGIASGVLAPTISDVPVLRSILPTGLQKKNASELAAEKEAAAEEAAAEEAAAEEAAAEEAVAEEAAAEEAAAEEAAEEEAAAEEAAEEEAAEEEAEQAAEEEAAALQDYVDTYSAMKPKDAAKVFDSMMPDKEDLIVKILENLKPDARAAILSKMSVANAAILTEKMQQ